MVNRYIFNDTKCLILEEALKAKNAASIGMSRIILERMKNHRLATEDRNYAIRAVINVMFSEYVTLPMKVNLQYFLLLLYTVDEGKLISQKHFINNVYR